MLINSLYTKLLRTKTPFSHGAVSALVCSVGSSIAIIADLFWLVMDMNHSYQWYHIPVGIALLISMAICGYSFIWLHKSITIKFNSTAVNRINICGERIDVVERKLAAIHTFLAQTDQVLTQATPEVKQLMTAFGALTQTEKH